MKGNKPRNRSAFTLIELMIVVAIIGILASVAIPTFNGYVKRTKHVEAMTHLKDMYQGLATYYYSDQVSEGTGSTLGIHCMPVGTANITAGTGQPIPYPVVTNAKAVGDFAGNATFAAIDFAPVGTLWHSYAFLQDSPSHCSFATTSQAGGVAAFSDHDSDGDLDIVGIMYQLVDNELRKGAGIVVTRDLPNPW